MDMLDFFGLYTRDAYSRYAFVALLAVSVVGAALTRPPVSKVTYQMPKKDFAYEVLIADLLESPAPNIVISTNTTFDTDMSSGLISPESVQGKFTSKFFNGNTAELDRQINASLKGESYEDHPDGKGKKKKYPVGTVAKVTAHGKTFYLAAMAELNSSGTAHSNVGMIDTTLEKLWTYIAEKGELGDVATAIIGTGRGRIRLPRKKVVERIAQSFADASRERVFANRLIIAVHPGDAEKFSVNLFEIRDYLTQSLHA